MAVDTAQKRRSMLSFGDVLIGERVPAGALSTALDRSPPVFLYAGLDISGTPPTPPAPAASAHRNLLKRKRLGTKGG